MAFVFYQEYYPNINLSVITIIILFIIQIMAPMSASNYAFLSCTRWLGAESAPDKKYYMKGPLNQLLLIGKSWQGGWQKMAEDGRRWQKARGQVAAAVTGQPSLMSSLLI